MLLLFRICRTTAAVRGVERRKDARSRDAESFDRELYGYLIKSRTGTDSRTIHEFLIKSRTGADSRTVENRSRLLLVQPVKITLSTTNEKIGLNGFCDRFVLGAAPVHAGPYLRINPFISFQGISFNSEMRN